MKALVVDLNIPADLNLGSSGSPKYVSDLQEDITIGADNSIDGTLKYVSDYSSQFPNDSSGHYLALHAWIRKDDGTQVNEPVQVALIDTNGDQVGAVVGTSPYIFVSYINDTSWRVRVRWLTGTFGHYQVFEERIYTLDELSLALNKQLVVDTDIAVDDNLNGKVIGDLQSDITIGSDDSITGTLHWVSIYPGFTSGSTNGYYLALRGFIENGPTELVRTRMSYNGRGYGSVYHSGNKSVFRLTDPIGNTDLENIKVIFEWVRDWQDQNPIETRIFDLSDLTLDPKKQLIIDTNIPSDANLRGKTVSDLQSNIEVGTYYVNGTLNYVENYNGAAVLFDDPSSPNGYVLALHVTIENTLVGRDDTYSVSISAGNGTEGRHLTAVESGDPRHVYLFEVHDTDQVITVVWTEDPYGDNPTVIETRTLSLTGLTLASH